MGAILKFILFTVLFFWIFSKAANFLLRMFAGNPSNGRSQFQGNQSRKQARDGNVNIDYVPKDQVRKKKSGKEGEYIDFEEVKE